MIAPLITDPHDARQSVFDTVINWSHQNSLWPLFFGLSCCFVEEATAFTSRYDISRFGSEVFRGSPRQADLLIVSGTVFKKAAPVILRLYEQMAEPKWVISMGSCSNSGGMYDVYSVVQGVDQILPVDIYIPGCPPRPEALLEGLIALQRKIAAEERPAAPSLGLTGGTQGTTSPLLVDGVGKSRDPRGPGYGPIPIRGTSELPPHFSGSRSQVMWTPGAREIELPAEDGRLTAGLVARFGSGVRELAPTSDMLCLEVAPARIREVLRYLKTEATPPYERLDDLTAIDESARRDHAGPQGLTVVYHLLSLQVARRLRLKVRLPAASPELPSATQVWPSANWYEREAHEMFGIRFAGHPGLRQLLLPDGWPGHPLRKEYPGRATELAPYLKRHAQRFQPAPAAEILGHPAADGHLLVNIGPHHYSTHGVLRIVVDLYGEEISDCALEIGNHHRGVEKIGERQSWHQFIPYTDRVDYLSGVANNLSYLTAVETLAGIQVPERAQYIRVLLCELFRLSNHLLWLGTVVQDLGMMSAIFYTFREREMIMDIVEMITGGRLHPSWFRIGGTAMDLPKGWQEPVLAFSGRLAVRLMEYEALINKNPIFLARTKGVGRLTRAQAIDWGVTGPNLRACGVEWDLRKKIPYSAYDQFAFEVPTASGGDCLARYLVRVEEMRQSLKIVEQAARRMPQGRYLTEDPRYTLPRKEESLQDIEALIHHFVNVSRGPTLPAGEAYAATEAPRGEQGYFVVSDGGSMPYRLRIRAPGFANIQALPLMAKGETIADLVAILGSLDYILPDIDR